MFHVLTHKGTHSFLQPPISRIVGYLHSGVTIRPCSGHQACCLLAWFVSGRKGGGGASHFVKADVEKCWGAVARAAVSLFLPVSTSPLFSYLKFSYLKSASLKKNEKRFGKLFWQSTEGVLAVAEAHKSLQ